MRNDYDLRNARRCPRCGSLMRGPTISSHPVECFELRWVVSVSRYVCSESACGYVNDVPNVTRSYTSEMERAR